MPGSPATTYAQEAMTRVLGYLRPGDKLSPDAQNYVRDLLALAFLDGHTAGLKKAAEVAVHG